MSQKDWAKPVLEQLSINSSYEKIENSEDKTITTSDNKNDSIAVDNSASNNGAKSTNSEVAAGAGSKVTDSIVIDEIITNNDDTDTTLEPGGLPTQGGTTETTEGANKDVLDDSTHTPEPSYATEGNATTENPETIDTDEPNSTDTTPENTPSTTIPNENTVHDDLTNSNDSVEEPGETPEDSETTESIDSPDTNTAPDAETTPESGEVHAQDETIEPPKDTSTDAPDDSTNEPADYSSVVEPGRTPEDGATPENADNTSTDVPAQDDSMETPEDIITDVPVVDSPVLGPGGLPVDGGAADDLPDSEIPHDGKIIDHTTGEEFTFDELKNMDYFTFNGVTYQRLNEEIYWENDTGELISMNLSELIDLYQSTEENPQETPAPPSDLLNGIEVILSGDGITQSGASITSLLISN
jgi:hypothetical protein